MALLSPLTPETERLLSRLPPPGEAHRWLSRIASRLANTIPKNRTIDILTQAAAHITHRRITEREILDAAAFGYGETPPSKSRKFNWPDIYPDLIAEVIAEHDPICNPNQSTGLKPSDVMPSLFPIYSWICLAMDTYTASAHIWPDDLPNIDSQNWQFICPNPLKGPSALNQKGEESTRCINNILERRFVIVEFDQEPDKWAQARLINFLSSSFHPCCMVVDSAGKSLHAWFRADHMSEDEAAILFGKAAALGADRTVFDLSKLVRMPGGIRAGGQRQRIVYFDQEALH
jgi:hypothetical protein